MNSGELEVLVALIGSVKPKTVIEFGVNEGRTAKALLSNVPTIETYIGVDVPPTYQTSKEVQRREIPARPGHLAMEDKRFELRLKPRGSLDLTVNDLPPAEAVFIDGDHGFEAVLNDTALARSLVGRGGIIVWHDYHSQDTVDVRRVLDVLHKHDPDSKLQYVENTWLAFEPARKTATYFVL